MHRYSILVLTDHSAHSKDNSVYDLCAALRRNPATRLVHLASRGNPANRGFFYDHSTTQVKAWAMRREISFETGQKALAENTFTVDVGSYDVIWLRLPRPIPDGFFPFLTSHVDEYRIINRPSGIHEVGNKAFLTNFPEMTPPSKWCRTVEEVWSSHERAAVVLKPVESYGGRGVVKLQRGQIYDGNRKIPFTDYLPHLEDQLNKGGYLAMKYLKNVTKGDKRIVVVNGQVVGAALRVPPKGSWICNAAQGGSASYVQPDSRELWMVDRLNAPLLERGIAMYGIDTLVGDDGERTLSEINALSIGGIRPMETLSGLPLVQRAADLLMEYVAGNVGDRRSVAAGR